MMDTDTPKPWVDARLPYAGGLRARLFAARLAPDAPYLATLPVLITVALVLMAASGFILSVFYRPADAFASIQSIDRNVNSGWLIQAMHQTGTTMIFGAVYITLFRAMLRRDYRAPGELLWLLGIAQFALLLLVGYLGYLMADGAVSYWSLATNAAGAANLPGLAGSLGGWVFGGPDGAGTLARIAVFHTIGALAIFGIILLYRNAGNLLAPAPQRRLVAFHPYYTAQYFVAIVVFALIFAVLLFFAPHLGSNPLNAGAADPLLLPVTMTPPWYLLGIAAISQILPTGLGSVIAVLAGLGVLAALPWLDRSSPARPPGGLYKVLVVVLALDLVLLSIFAAAPPSTSASVLVLLFSLYYFLHFAVLTPLVTARETT